MNTSKSVLFRIAQVLVILAMAFSVAGAGSATAGPSLGDWDGEFVMKPSVLPEGGGDYKMWYDGVDSLGYDRIGMATSDDGLSWTKYAGNPVLTGGTAAWDAGGEHAPFVRKEGDTYQMWYEGANANGLRQLGYATSADGIAWTKYDGNPVLHAGPEPYDQEVAGHGSVFRGVNAFRLWYHAIGDEGIIIAYATSPDGITWTKQGPVLRGRPGRWDGGVWGPSVLNVNGTFWMWYTGGGGGFLPSSIGAATSGNGRYWTRVSPTPVIQMGGNAIGDPHVVLEGDTFKMWFHNWSTGKIYYAESADGIDWSQPVVALEPGLAGTLTTITADTPDPSMPDESVAVHVIVSGGSTTPTGTVDISGADANCQITLSDGSGSCDVVFTALGARTLTATYNGDAAHAASSDTAPHKVWLMMKFVSQPGNDGWVLESGENSSVGGSMNNTATTLGVGDSAQDRQYRSLLSFNTAGLPDTATIKRVQVYVRRSSVTGTNPLRTHGGLKVDINKPYFGAGAGLALSDFQAGADLLAACIIGRTPTNGWYRGTFATTALIHVNKLGTTQLRLRFAAGDNDDSGADVLNLFSGNSISANRPYFIVWYMP